MAWLLLAMAVTSELGVLAQESGTTAITLTTVTVTPAPDAHQSSVTMTTSVLMQDMASPLISDLESSMMEEASSQHFEKSPDVLAPSSSSDDTETDLISSSDLFTDNIPDNMSTVRSSSSLTSNLDIQTSLVEESVSALEFSDFSSVMEELSSSASPLNIDSSSLISDTLTDIISVVLSTSQCLDCSSSTTSEAMSSTFIAQPIPTASDIVSNPSVNSLSPSLVSSNSQSLLSSISTSPISSISPSSVSSISPSPVSSILSSAISSISPLSVSSISPSAVSSISPTASSPGDPGSSATAQRSAADNATIELLQRDRERLKDEVSDLEEKVDDLTISTAVLGALIFTVVSLFIFIKCIRYHMNKAELNEDSDMTTRHRTTNNNSVAYFRPQSSYFDMDLPRSGGVQPPSKDDQLVSFSYQKPKGQLDHQQPASEQIHATDNSDSTLEMIETKPEVEFRRPSPCDLGMSDAFDALNNVGIDDAVNEADTNGKHTSFIEVKLNDD